MKATELLYIDDFPRVVELARKHIEECEPDTPFEEEELLACLFSIVNDTARLEKNAWVLWDGGVIVGYALANMFKQVHNKQYEAVLRYHYVQPESRSGTGAFHLLHNFQNWAKLNGAAVETVGAGRIYDPEMAKRINKMYERRGFIPIGAWLQRKVKG